MFTSSETAALEPTKVIGSATEFNRMKSWIEDRVKRCKSDAVAEVVTLTPVLAQLLLDRNPINRPIGKYNAAALRDDVANGRFMFNGESIVISNTGVLLDGQHRCVTVIATKKPIQTVLVFGPVEASRYTIDIGTSKTAANFLHMKGRKDTNNLAATIALLLQYRETGLLNYSVKPTKTAIVQAADQFKGVDASVDVVGGATKKQLGSRSVLAFCHYSFWKRSNRETADTFITRLLDGDGLRKGDPIYYCRERLRDMDRGTTQNTRAALVFRCWNAWRRGELVTKMSVSGASALPKLER